MLTYDTAVAEEGLHLSWPWLLFLVFGGYRRLSKKLGYSKIILSRNYLNFLGTFSLRRCCVIPRVGSHAPTNGVESTGQRNGAQPQMTAPLDHSARTESGVNLELPTATSHWSMPKLSCKHSRTLGSTLHSYNSFCIHICFLPLTPLVFHSISIPQWLNPLIPLFHYPAPQKTYYSSRKSLIGGDLE